MDTTRPWALHEAVSVRPEPFGALLYHFGNRKLSFLKDRRLLELVRALPEHDSVDAAMAATDIGADDRARFTRALESLVASDIVVPRTSLEESA
ncbi:mycofactocin biosynthesis chaperone MftB [Epidermidibacterium keratini]|nr:mycofactocin biosynthesis chaperone MftB [Epidermidibacterium keratini]